MIGNCCSDFWKWDNKRVAGILVWCTIKANNETGKMPKHTLGTLIVSTLSLQMICYQDHTPMTNEQCGANT